MTDLLPLITAVILFPKLNKTLKKLSVFVLLNALSDGIAIILGYNGINNMPISHIFALLQVAIFAWIFLGIFKGRGRTIVLLVLIQFLLFSALNWFLWESFLVFNSNQRYVAAIALIIYCTGYFVYIFVKTSIERIEHDPYFWMCASVLLYTTGTLFLFIFGQEILNGKNVTFWNLNSTLNIILNIGLTLTLWQGRKKLL